MKVFLGGTCAESKWRDYIIPKLKCDYFNPVVDDWTPECQEIEEREKRICGCHLYVITPKMKGVFSIAEATNDSIYMGNRCVFCITKEDDDRDWTDGEMKSLKATGNLIAENGGKVFYSLDDVIDYLNDSNFECVRNQRDFYKKKWEHDIQYWNLLIKQIIPEGWYSMAMDTWDGIEEEYRECVSRLNRPFVQKIIKRKNF